MFLIAVAVIIFLLMLSLLVFVHEAGHFFVAKWSGVKVEEFGFGLPPRALGKQIGETIYSLNWLPFGGFVKLYGEDEAGAGKVSLQSTDPVSTGDEGTNTRSFVTKPLTNRIAIVVAGVFMNLLLAVAIYYVILISHGFSDQISLLFNHHFVGVTQTNHIALVLGDTAVNSPARQAGLQPLDRIVDVNGQKLTTAEDFVSFVGQHEGMPITLGVLNQQDQRRDVTVTPRKNFPLRQGPLGVSIQDVATATLTYSTPRQKIFSGFTHTYNIGIYSFEAFGKIIGQSVAQHNATPVREGVAGPVGILVIIKDILSLGGGKAFSSLLAFTALLSLNLAVVNIFPFPALDGGRLLFLVIEGVTRRKVSPSLERVVNVVGMTLLLCLIFLITSNDLLKIFQR